MLKKRRYAAFDEIKYYTYVIHVSQPSTAISIDDILFRSKDIYYDIKFNLLGKNVGRFYTGFNAYHSIHIFTKPKYTVPELAHEAELFNLTLERQEDEDLYERVWLFSDKQDDAVGVISYHEYSESIRIEIAEYYAEKKELADALFEHCLGRRVIKTKSKDPKTFPIPLDVFIRT